MKHAYRWPALLGLFVLTACGGGGHSSGGGSTPPQTYTVGGTISGLTASGLVLNLASGGSTVGTYDAAASATTFTFTTQLASGSTFAVTVGTNPTGETCTPSANSSGTVSANVTNVTISCAASTPPVTYTIGGTIEGLTASGLVLVDNGGDAYDATASTAFPFTFATALVTGSTYDVTVQTQPAGETCNVSNGSGLTTANITTVTVSCSAYAGDLATNAVTVTVGNGPTGSSQQFANVPYVTITVCEHGTTTCATIDNVEVDTGSSGLRLLASALAHPDAGSAVTLTSYTPAGLSSPISECWSLGSAVAWGAVDTADISIGPESAASVPVQVIDSTTPPTACIGGGTQLSSVSDFDANGVLGVGVRAEDCGTACSGNYSYFECNPCTSVATSSTLTTAQQVPNPVTLLTNKSGMPDNNGVILQLPAIPDAGLPTATGYLVFGIGTESDNGIGSATALEADSNGDITTTFGGVTNPSYFDSGSNLIVFDGSSDTSLAICTTGGFATGQYYCPTSTQTLMATNTAGTGSASTTATFDIANAENLSQNNFALDDIGAATTGFFDWGLPFFYGRTVFVGIQGETVTGGPSPNTNGFFAY